MVKYAEKKEIEQNQKLNDMKNINNHKRVVFYKNKENDTIFWIDNVDNIGERLFTFDKKKIYNLFADYPHNLTKKEKELFDKENPYWRDFFADRK